MQDDGMISVESSEGGEPYQCETIDECRQYVDKMLAEEAGESPEEQATEGPENYGKKSPCKSIPTPPAVTPCAQQAIQ